MGLGMRGRGAEQRAGGIAVNAAENLGQPDQRACDRCAPLRRMTAVGGETAQQRRAPPQRGQERLELGFGFQKADAAEVARNQAPGECVLQREVGDAARLVAGGRSQSRGDKILEGVDRAGRKDLADAGRDQGDGLGSLPRQSYSWSATSAPAPDRLRRLRPRPRSAFNGGGRRLRAGMAADVGGHLSPRRAAARSPLVRRCACWCPNRR